MALLPSDPFRRRNWIAIAVATVLMLFSYSAYAAAFSGSQADPNSFDSSLLGVALVAVPFVFIALAFGSRSPRAPINTLKAMALTIPVGLSFGLVSPVLGATAAFGLGGALTLRRPSVSAVLKWRLWSVVFTVFYTLLLLVVIPPAGVFTGGTMPLIMLGLADEYAIWGDEDNPLRQVSSTSPTTT